MIAGSLLMASTTVVDQGMAALLGPGNVSTLGYGTKVVGLCTQLGALTLSAAVFPHFAKLAANREWTTLRATFRFYFRLTLATTILVTIGLVALSEPIVRVVFQRGAFTAADTAVVARVQAFSLLQVPFYVTGTLVVRLISSLKANHVLMWGTLINVSLNLALDWVLMQRLGVAGIALSTAAVYFVSFSFLRWMLGRVLAAREREGEPALAVGEGGPD
jgi:putative peptidoglycan lipid II flippase